MKENLKKMQEFAKCIICVVFVSILCRFKNVLNNFKQIFEHDSIHELIIIDCSNANIQVI